MYRTVFTRRLYTCILTDTVHISLFLSYPTNRLAFNCTCTVLAFQVFHVGSKFDVGNCEILLLGDCIIQQRGVESFHNRSQNSPAMYHLQLSAPRQNLLVVHRAMAFTIVASGSTCKASTPLAEAALSQCRATHRQKSSWPYRQITAPRALGLGRSPAPPSRHSTHRSSIV